MSLPGDWPELVLILRGLDTATATAAATAAVRGGVRAIEVTIDSPGATTTIAELTGLGPEVRVGAGTVRSVGQVERAAAAGAGFLLSPHVDRDVIAATRGAGLLSIPGAYTPTEIHTAWSAGADLVKVFPVQPAGPAYLRAVRDPLPDVPLLACGGLTAELSRACLELGCLSVGVGIGLIDADAVRAGDWARLERSCAAYLAAALEEGGAPS